MITYIDSPSGATSRSESSTCPKCQHLNPPLTRNCAHCNRHLLVFCRHCGHENHRDEARCSECRTQLHFRWPDKWKSAKARTWIRPVEIILVVTTAIFAAKGIVALGSLDLPKQVPQTPAPVYVVNPGGTPSPR